MISAPPKAQAATQPAAPSIDAALLRQIVGDWVPLKPPFLSRRIDAADIVSATAGDDLEPTAGDDLEATATLKASSSWFAGTALPLDTGTQLWFVGAALVRVDDTAGQRVSILVRSDHLHAIPPPAVIGGWRSDERAQDFILEPTGNVRGNSDGTAWCIRCLIRRGGEGARSAGAHARVGSRAYAAWVRP